MQVYQRKEREGRRASARLSCKEVAAPGTPRELDLSCAHLRDKHYCSELAKSRKTFRGLLSIGEPCDTRMRFSDSISAHCRS